MRRFCNTGASIEGLVRAEFAQQRSRRWIDLLPICAFFVRIWRNGTPATVRPLDNAIFPYVSLPQRRGEADMHWLIQCGLDAP
jgi:hypothetical protein